MAVKKPAKKATGKPAKASRMFSAEEKAAMREHVAEMRRPRGSQQDEERVVLDKIAAMPPRDRAMAERIHALVKAAAPSLTPRLWYGMPAYSKDGKTICFFQDANKFKSRYATLGFSDNAKLDEGDMWPSAYALMKLTPADEARIAALIKKAVG
jgi:uncharacterized protein YdhG (YjbR/CyaY superfamily)